MSRALIFKQFQFRKAGWLLCFTCLWLISGKLYAQTGTLVKGRVTDAETGEPLPFVSVSVKGTSVGVTSDFDGFYTLKLNRAADSVTASYVGYVTRSKAIKPGISQVINFQLAPSSYSIKEVEITNGENPAWRIMRKVITNKDRNDKRNLAAYEYDAYTKIELDVDNISDRFKKRKVVQKALGLFDSLQVIAGEDGKPILPVFISESSSKYYYLSQPKKVKENILATKVTGIGVTDGSLVSQLIGSSYQEFNFYQNWVGIVGKDFVSPIAESWKGYYEYFLADSSFLGSHWCYRIEITPKRKQDLAFTGTIWIADTSFALKQVDLMVGKEANLNYIEKINIQQELMPTAAGPWLPKSTRLLIDVAELTKKWAGMLAKLYTSSRNVTVNQPRPLPFYDQAIAMEEDALRHTDEAYWKQHRHDSLTAAENTVYAMIDSMRDLPLVKTYVEIANIAVNGYKSVGKVEFGPYAFLYAFNRIEGHRIRLGARTTSDFSKKLELNGHLAYGTRDGRFKYSSGLRYIYDRKPWSEMGVSHSYDIEQLGLPSDQIIDNTLFLAFSRFGNLRSPYLNIESKFFISREVLRGVNQKVTLRSRYFKPLFPFAYVSNNVEGGADTLQSFRTTEVVLETRYAHNEVFLQKDNSRISLGNEGWPVVYLRYTAGVKGLLGGNFSYHKLQAGISQDLPMGTFGNSRYVFTAGKIFTAVPYPLLEVHLGNQTPFYSSQSYNLMRFLEFVSDQYVSLRYDHNFEGLFFNRLPLISRLKWREVAWTNLLYGHISEANLKLIPAQIDGQEVTGFRKFTHLPYVEVGYGISNIFRIIRVDAIHRLTYRQFSDAHNFGVKVSVEFAL